MSKTVVNKVTKVVWDNGFKPDGVNIPSVTSADEGKVLAVDSNGKWVAASPSAPQSELPVYTAADEGKILKVDDQGSLEWAEDDNTQYTAGDNVSIVNGEISAVDTTYTAGANVQISAENVISATDTTYTAGTGISISAGNAISADSQLPSVTSVDEGKVLKVDSNGDWAVGTDEDTKYTAGTNVSISAGNVISATDTTYTAGANVQINDGVISATDTTYSAGANVQINDGVISATDTTYTAGTNVQINNGVISATDTTYTAGNGITITGTSIAADAQLPSVDPVDEGNVLTVDSQGHWVPDAVPKELPTVSTADEGKILEVDATGHWAKANNSAAMVKAAIADDYAGADGTLPFYPVFDDAIASNANMERDCLAAVSTMWNSSMGIRPYDHDQTHNIYMAVIDPGDPNVPPRAILFVVGNTAANVYYQYINGDGSLGQDGGTYVSTAFSGTVNSGFYGSISINIQVTSTYDSLITCAKDLSLCTYATIDAAVAAFGAWQIPGSYSEGDQVWKDGKLQTYTSGAWVDSDPIVEQIANAGGGGGGSTTETWELIGGDYAQLNTYAVNNGSAYTIPLNNNIDYTQYKRMVVEFYVAESDTASGSDVDAFLKANPVILTGEKNPDDAGATSNPPAPFVFPPQTRTYTTTSSGVYNCKLTVITVWFNSTNTGLSVSVKAPTANGAAGLHARVKVYGIK